MGFLKQRVGVERTDPVGVVEILPGELGLQSVGARGDGRRRPFLGREQEAAPLQPQTDGELPARP